jgi:tRNA threonylcarbamoyladenosine biosynthesis protein TsaB
VTVLGIETATDICSSAVVIDSRVVSELSVDQPRIHAEVLLPQIEEVLQAARVRLDQIDGIAVSIGPGSFTGLRIGLGVAKGLAWASGKPLAAVPTMKALAGKTRRAGLLSESELLLTALYARRGEIYCRLDRMKAGMLVPVWNERAAAAADIVAELDEDNVVVTGDYSQLSLRHNMRTVTGEIAGCSAGAVALEGEEMLLHGGKAEVELLEPLYVMDFTPKLKQRVQ